MTDATVGVPEKAEPGDILINEVMFETSSAEPDYVEMLVNTQKVIDLRSLIMCITDADGNITARNMASEWTRLAFADQYMVLTTDSAKCADAYEAVNPQWIVHSASPISTPKSRA